MHRIEAYVTLALIFVATTTVLYLPVLFVLKKRGKSVIRQLGYLALFCSAFLIIFATILFSWPITFRPERYVLNLIPFQWLSEPDIKNQLIVEVVPNVWMFLPLGMFLPVVFKKMRRIYKTALIVFFVTFSVEFFQYFIGRSSDIDDIIANLSGGIIGYGIFRGFDRLFQRKNWWNKFLGGA